MDNKTVQAKGPEFYAIFWLSDLVTLKRQVGAYVNANGVAETARRVGMSQQTVNRFVTRTLQPRDRTTKVFRALISGELADEPTVRFETKRLRASQSYLELKKEHDAKMKRWLAAKAARKAARSKKKKKK